MANLEPRIKKLERSQGVAGDYPLVFVQGEHETQDQAVERHLEQYPGLEAYLAKHPKRPLVNLDG
ncbi:hypothetical protein [Desulfonatronum thiodismutans]|uniref:hypothetical protein n=1 Tax=Desulfonatronum thiodismutans TaxID=159290 RepID=UPI0004ABE6E9|nr:hypothetical protein [Desulfonatronum thiodismutans]